MASFRYRAMAFDGSPLSGKIDAANRGEAIIGLRRRTGTTLLELAEAPRGKTDRPPRATGRHRAATQAIVGELAVLLAAGLQLDRALMLAIENIEDRSATIHLDAVLRAVREGVPLSQAMARTPAFFSPTAIAMTEAGEANGKLADALERLAHAIGQDAELRRIVVSSTIYPIALAIIAVGVILLMLLFVVPQFESMFAATTQALPAATVFIMEASRVTRRYGIAALGGLALTGAAVSALLRQSPARLAVDRMALAMPLLGELIRRIETARFARTLGALIEGEVALPAAIRLAQRTITNQVMARAILQVADGVKEGGGLTGPLAVTGVLPPLAIGFLRTGEETSQLGMMLSRLAAVLDRDIRTRLERLIGILTPVITVVLGATVASIIAAIMSAILGFNDLAMIP